PFFRLLKAMRQHLAKLCYTGAAHDRAHQTAELAAVLDPALRLTLILPAVKNELHFKISRRTEHLALKLGGLVPGRLPGRSCIESEDQSPLFWRLLSLGNLHLPGASQKGIDI